MSKLLSVFLKHMALHAQRSVSLFLYNSVCKIIVSAFSLQRIFSLNFFFGLLLYFCWILIVHLMSSLLQLSVIEHGGNLFSLIGSYHFTLQFVNKLIVGMIMVQCVSCFSVI